MTIELTPQEEDTLLTLLAPIVNEEPTDAQQSLYDKVYCAHDTATCPKCSIYEAAA
ncbi:MAG TPA: hypothetical protein VKT82_26195 [Ktedonobacterales bacterium]|nr:hypothetical protein [Ktedonobacterales bacterium]